MARFRIHLNKVVRRPKSGGEDVEFSRKQVVSRKGKGMTKSVIAAIDVLFEDGDLEGGEKDLWWMHDSKSLPGRNFAAGKRTNDGKKFTAHLEPANGLLALILIDDDEGVEE